MIKKVPIDPTRVRKIPPEGFSWIERRFIRDGFIDRLPPEAILLYFFLAAVSDLNGLSFYSDPTLGKILKLNPEELTQSRARLTAAGLILYRYPLYQVLPVPPKPKPTQSFCAHHSKPQPQLDDGPISIGEILKMAEEACRRPK